jgi:hypothetical protein
LFFGGAAQEHPECFAPFAIIRTTEAALRRAAEKQKDV